MSQTKQNKTEQSKAVQPELKYKDLIRQSQQQQEEEQFQFQVEQAEQQLLSDISATKLSLSSAKKELSEAKRAYPFSSTNIINAMQKVEGLENGLAILENLKSELF